MKNIFTPKEAEVFRGIALECGFEDPSAALLSQNRLDMCIRRVVQEGKRLGLGGAVAEQNFLSKLYDFRQKAEIAAPGKESIFSSKEIRSGQQLEVFVPDTGYFSSKVVKNTDGYMTISRPTEDGRNPVKNWIGKKISVY
ncbi:MAG: PilZ domain-containing protein, partial [Treponema sp.]|nr:PilZ domain-containing protein [Treponema sp.]